MERDYTALIFRIRSKYLRLEDFAKDLGITICTLTSKLKGKTDWKREEMIKAAELLDFTPDEILSYFFNF